MLKNQHKLLEAKIQIPDEQNDYQRREKLLLELEAEPMKLVILHATIGYGKTVLLSQYVKRPDTICAWYHLDSMDNDINTFVQYLVFSLQRALGDFVFEVESYLEPEAVPIPLMFRELVMELNDYLGGMPERKLFLVLDDFQTLNNPEIFSLLEELLDHTGNQVRLLVATKSTVPDFLTKYVMRGTGKVLDSRKLSFMEEEAYCVLERVLSKKEADEYTDVIWKNMEGWPAGIMFAALYIRQLGNQVSKVDWEHICQESMVQNYIAHELFKKLPYDIQNFLLKTSFCDELQPELCNAICGIRNAGGILKYLLQENMFILHMGDRKDSYRYHSIFRSFLMTQAGEELGKEVYENLAEYYMKHQNPAVASRYAYKAGNEELLTLLGESVSDGVLETVKPCENQKLLSVSCFGKFRVKLLPKGKEISWRTRKAMELFAYLVDLEGKPVERRVLLEQLWPEDMPNNAVAMLHNMIYSIRKELSDCPGLERVIQYRNRQYYLDMSLVESDLASKKQICELAEQGNVEELLKCREQVVNFWGVYLEEVDGSWCASRRAYFERTYGKVCRLLAGYAEKEKDYELAVRLWRAYMEADRYSEEAVAGLIRAYGGLGERKQVKKVFETAKKLFLEELGLELGSEVLQAYEEGMGKMQKKREKTG